MFCEGRLIPTPGAIVSVGQCAPCSKATGGLDNDVVSRGRGFDTGANTDGFQTDIFQNNLEISEI